MERLSRVSIGRKHLRTAQRKIKRPAELSFHSPRLGRSRQVGGGLVMNRIEILKGFLNENPNDSFSRYALALEYVKLGQNDDALREFETVQTNDPQYVATYYQLGQLYQKLGQKHEAEKTFRTGITVAAKAGDEHTRSELEAALEAIL